LAGGGNRGRSFQHGLEVVFVRGMSAARNAMHDA